MNDARRRWLAHRYAKLCGWYDARLWEWGCGRQLAEHLDGEMASWRTEIDAIVMEVEAVIHKEAVGV